MSKGTEFSLYPISVQRTVQWWKIWKLKVLLWIFLINKGHNKAAYYRKYHKKKIKDEALMTLIITSSNGNIFRVTGPSWRESIGHRWIPLTKAPVTRSFDALFVLGLKRMSKQARRRWFETHCSHYDVTVMRAGVTLHYSRRTLLSFAAFSIKRSLSRQVFQ